MRVVVTGATGNVGTSVLRALGDEDAVDSIVGIARRRPDIAPPKVDWVEADIVESDLVPHFRGADAVVHLAWLIQPSRRREVLRAVNVDGSLRVFDAVARAGVGALVYASSVGAYSPGPKDRAVDESWPTEGIASSFYAQDKAAVEELLDEFERGQAGVRVVRLRPGLIFKGEAATEIRRLFLGPFVPPIAFSRRAIPFVPRMRDLRFQAVHSYDVGEAYRLAVVRLEATGAFNLAADPVLDSERLGRILGARPVPVPRRAVRALLDWSWRLRLQPSPPGWLDMALSVPIMDATRARNELGWTPRYRADEALLELLDGLRHGEGADTPPLDPETSGPLRSHELRTGVGARGR
jgi:nucleoside-diphosphate-sugar epimerase